MLLFRKIVEKGGRVMININDLKLKTVTTNFKIDAPFLCR